MFIKLSEFFISPIKCRIWSKLNNYYISLGFYSFFIYLSFKKWLLWWILKLKVLNTKIENLKFIFVNDHIIKLLWVWHRIGRSNSLSQFISKHQNSNHFIWFSRKLYFWVVYQIIIFKLFIYLMPLVLWNFSYLYDQSHKNGHYQQRNKKFH